MISVKVDALRCGFPIIKPNRLPEPLEKPFCGNDPTFPKPFPRPLPGPKPDWPCPKPPRPICPDFVELTTCSGPKHPPLVDLDCDKLFRIERTCPGFELRPAGD